MGCICSKPAPEAIELEQSTNPATDVKLDQEKKPPSISSVIYGGDPFYSKLDEPHIVDNLKTFTTIICWALHIDENANLTFNNIPLIKNGDYVGDSKWASKLASLKADPTSNVKRVMFSIGGASPPIYDFQHVKRLGTGSDSPLYKAFAALKKNIPCIDGFDFDDEDLLDHDTIIDFAQMLGGMGYQVTFCPYSNQQFWISCLKTLHKENPGLVTGFNLQCYAGGASNHPGQWINAIKKAMPSDFYIDGFVVPGLWCRHDIQGTPAGQCPCSIQETFNKWRSRRTTGVYIQGGFIWLFDTILTSEHKGLCDGGKMDAAAYAASIVSGLS